MIRGRTNLQALLLTITVAGALLLACRVLAGSNVLGNEITCTQTPQIVGESRGRALLEAKAKESGDVANAAKVGPWDLPTSTWWSLFPASFPKVWGILDNGQFTAEKQFGCVAAQATPVVVDFAEEGHMPDRTSTGTATVTATVTDTPTRTNTPTRTATPTITP